MADPLPQPTSSPPPPDVLDAFRRQAGPILAEERGMTAAALKKLAGLARGLGIAEVQVEAAIRSLHLAPAADNPGAAKFKRRLLKDLSGGKKAIIGPDIENKIVEVASRKYSLSTAAVRNVIAEVTAELGLRRITENEAFLHILETIDAAVGEATWLPRETWDRVRASGDKWGLSFEEVDELVDQKLAANRQKSAGRRWLARGLIGGGLAVAGCLAFYLAIKFGRVPEQEPNAAPVATSDSASNTEPAPPPREPAWWDPTLTLSLTRMRRDDASFAATYNLLAAKEPEDRKKGCDQLLMEISRLAPGKRRDRLLEIASSYLALEPDEDVAKHCLEGLLNFLPMVGGAEETAQPPSKERYEKAFAAASALAAALRRSGVSTARQEAIAGALGSDLGAAIPAAAPEKTLTKAVRSALAHKLLRHLGVAGAKYPAGAPELYDFIVKQAAVSLTAEELEAAQLALLEALLPAAGDDWLNFKPLIDRCCDSQNLTHVLKMLEIYRRIEAPRLQQHLGETLLFRTQAKAENMRRETVVAAVEKQLGAAGVSLAPQASDRWRRLAVQAKVALARAAPSAEDQAGWIAQTAQLADLATLALALAQGESGWPIYDELTAPEKPAPEKTPEADAAPEDRGASAKKPPRKATEQELRLLDQRIANLRSYVSEPPVVRTNVLRTIAQFGPLVADISSEQAEIIARYLLGEKKDDELTTALSILEPMRNWRHLRLAIADHVEGCELKVGQVMTLAQSLLKEAFTEANIRPDKQANRFRLALLQSVLADISAPPPAPRETPRAADDLGVLETALQNAYQRRARILGLTPAEYQRAASPSRTLELLLRPLRGGAVAGAALPEDEALLARLPHELVVADYLNGGDPQRTVALQRILLRLAARQLARQHPRQADTAAKTLLALEDADARAATALVQLHDGEAAFLRLELLYAVP